MLIEYLLDDDISPRFRDISIVPKCACACAVACDIFKLKKKIKSMSPMQDWKKGKCVYVTLIDFVQLDINKFQDSSASSHNCKYYTMEPQYCHMSPVFIPNDSFVKNKEKQRWISLDKHFKWIDTPRCMRENFDTVKNTDVIESCRSWLIQQGGNW